MWTGFEAVIEDAQGRRTRYVLLGTEAQAWAQMERIRAGRSLISWMPVEQTARAA